MKLFMEPVWVQSSKQGQPLRLTWRSQPYQVAAIHEYWLYHGQWWATPNLVGRDRAYFRVEAISGNGNHLEMEIFCEAGQWMLSRLQD